MADFPNEEQTTEQISLQLNSQTQNGLSGIVEPQTPSANSINISLTSNQKYCSNIEVRPISLTEEAMENILLKNKEIVEEKTSWTTPLGVVLTCGAALGTSTFKETLGFSADTWAAVFILGLLISLVILIVKAKKAFENREKGSVEYLMQEIKKKASDVKQEKIEDQSFLHFFEQIFEMKNLSI